MSEVPQILSDDRAFLAALEAAGCKTKGRTCTCPFHDDQTPSAQWSQGDDGTWRMYCHVCKRSANLADLIAHTSGRDSKDIFRELAEREKVKVAPTTERVLPNKQAVANYCATIGTVESWYKYGPTDAPVLVIARIMPASGKKTFRQFTPVSNGWVARNLIERGRIPLYRFFESSERILVVEGEKAADAAYSVGIPATTSAMGAGKAAESDWSPLRGKSVYLWPDNDETGIKHMREVRTILEGLDCTIAWIDPAGIGLPPKGDVADLIEALDGKSAEEIGATIKGIMEDAEPQGASQELAGLFDAIAAGKYLAIPWPGLERIGKLSKALLPGCITTLCADPGAGKSLLMLQMLAAWHRAGIKVAALELEDERRIHVQRILAQIVGLSSLVDDEWCRTNTQRAHQCLDACRSDIDAIGSCIRAEGEDQMKLDAIAVWIEDRAKEGTRIIIVDPVTAASTEREPWAADTAFLMRVKKIARTHQISVILVTHPRGMAKGASLAGMAGGSAYPRFSHCALWLEKFDQQEMRDTSGDSRVCNRSIKITKSRHGSGGGLTIGCLFDGETLRFGHACTLMDEPKKTRRQEAPKADASHQSARLRQQPHQGEDLFNEQA